MYEENAIISESVNKAVNPGIIEFKEPKILFLTLDVFSSLSILEKFSNSFGVQKSSSLLLVVIGDIFTEVLKQGVFGITSTLVQNTIAGMILDFLYHPNEILRNVTRQCANAMSLLGSPAFDYDSLLKDGRLGVDVKRQLVKALRRRK